MKIESNALSIESVSMNVPITIATPSTIATAVSAVRSFRPSKPFSAKRTIAVDGTDAPQGAERFPRQRSGSVIRRA